MNVDAELCLFTFEYRKSPPPPPIVSFQIFFQKIPTPSISFENFILGIEFCLKFIQSNQHYLLRFASEVI